MRPVERVLIHARGCTAVKLIRVAQRNGIEVVLVQSDPDMDSASVDMLTERDRVVCIGGNTPDESYLNAMSVLRVAEHERVDSLHPGIGFLSENSQFAELCRSHGINFIGPPVASMEAMGNKSNAINTALRLEVPVVPGSHGILTNVERAAEVANQIGYPVLIKAVHGGGGKGIQVVESPDDFHELFHRVTAEARAAFGNGDVYLEKYVTSLRHIEAQLLRDVHGNSKVLGLRDCSVQRDKQKILEESDSTMLPDELREAVLRLHRGDRRRSRLRRRRHRRVHFRSEIERRVLHGDEYAPAGGTSGDRTGLRRRHRRRTVPHRIRRKHCETRDRSPRLRDRSAHQRRTHRGRRGRQTAVPSRSRSDQQCDCRRKKASRSSRPRRRASSFRRTTTAWSRR